jgi:hypothetical protein
MKSVQAFIRWFAQRGDGSGWYSTVARFEDDENWPHQAWSLMVKVNHHYRDGLFSHATVQFLANEAPQQLLSEGSRFELLEGKRRIAKGVVLPAQVEVPADINDFESALIG